jgi:hypothetical protein
VRAIHDSQFLVAFINSEFVWLKRQRTGARESRRRSCCVRLCCEGSGCVSDERGNRMRGGGNGQRLRGRQEKRS